MEWDSSSGNLRYFDKTLGEKGENVSVPDGFAFLLLDQLATIKGWHDASESGIFSNEVRDTKSDQFVVKAFKGGTLVEGFYAQIKDRIRSLGGKYVANCYVGFKENGELKIGSVQFKGAALSAWMDFAKENRKEFFSKAIQIKGTKDGKKGSISFKVPVFRLLTTEQATNDAAVELDKKLQEYLKQYLTRPKSLQAQGTQPPTEEQPPQERRQPDHDPELDQPEEDDIPFTF